MLPEQEGSFLTATHKQCQWHESSHYLLNEVSLFTYKFERKLNNLKDIKKF